jgi:two-component system sensor histidine kinase BaeS
MSVDAGSAPPPRSGSAGRGSLWGQLVWAFVAVAALAALITGAVALSLIRLIPDRSLEQQLSSQADAIAANSGQFGQGPAAAAASRAARLCLAQRALQVSGTVVYALARDGTPALPCPNQANPRVTGAAPPPDVDLAAAVNAGAGRITSGTKGGLVYAVAPLADPGPNRAGVLLVHPARGLARSLLGPLAWRLLFATALAVVIAALVGAALAGRLTAPLGRLVGAARRLGGGNLATRVPVEGDDEVAEVGAAFNEMAEALERGQAEQQTFLASVGHELKTPLTAVQGYTEALLDGTVEDPAARRRSLERIHAETLRLARLVQDLLDLARLGRGQFAVNPVDTDAAVVLREAAATWSERAAARGVTVEQRLPAQLPARVDPGRLRQVLDNLLDNATRSSPPGRPVLLAAVQLPSRRSPSGGYRSADARRAGAGRGLALEPPGPPSGAEVAVVDQGPGIAAEDLPHVFDRGYLWSRYRGTRAVGSGLGLAIVKALCDAMGVTIWAESGGGGGTAFRLTLPPAASASGSAGLLPTQELPIPSPAGTGPGNGAPSGKPA